MNQLRTIGTACRKSTSAPKNNFFSCFLRHHTLNQNMIPSDRSLFVYLIFLSFLQCNAAMSSLPLTKSLSKPLRLFQSTRNTLKLSAMSTTEASLQSKQKRVGVLLLNLGGPEKQEVPCSPPIIFVCWRLTLFLQDVQGFLYNLFADPDIIQLPPPLGLLQKPLAYMISKNRAKKSMAAYQSIGGGSPIKK